MGFVYNHQIELLSLRPSIALSTSPWISVPAAILGIKAAQSLEGDQLRSDPSPGQRCSPHRHKRRRHNDEAALEPSGDADGHVRLTHSNIVAQQRTIESIDGGMGKTYVAISIA